MNRAAPAKSFAARAWPLAIGAVLAITVAANLAMWAAANAPGAAVPETDYYRRALAWDQAQAERARSAALGWSAYAAFVHTGDGPRLEVTLRDAGGRRLEGAHAEATAVHNLAAGSPQHWRLEPRGPGVYLAIAGPPRSGRWELVVTAQRGADRFVTVLHADAPR